MKELEQTFYYPNKMGRIILLSLEEVIGQENVSVVLKQAGLDHYINHFPPDDLELKFSFSELSQLQVGLEQLYGPRAGRGIALRAGRVCFKHGLREFGPMLGLADLSFRLAPFDAKLRMGAEVFADIFNRFTDQRVRVESTPQALAWHIDVCPVCWQRTTDAPVCHLAVGILQESLYWVSGGKVFKVEETACIAKGDSSCTILIHKESLD